MAVTLAVYGAVRRLYPRHRGYLRALLAAGMAAVAAFIIAAYVERQGAP